MKLVLETLDDVVLAACVSGSETAPPPEGTCAACGERPCGEDRLCEDCR